ncbi:MAG: redox-regulated ATPase YchF [Acholeplasmatales bacterium]|nr:MAG: redox-regulated ATPase YchF [Acholeplasmatales bacterium]
MPLSAGIIGLPNVGKSTVFNALTRAEVLAANYPFSTLEPNVGTVVVPDERLERLASMLNPAKTIPTTVEFTDIAGLVKGASKGEGLGNQFLAHIRNVDAVIHVLRCFEDGDVSHVDGTVDPVRDMDTVLSELMLADLDTAQKRLPKIEKKAWLKVDVDITREYEVLMAVRDCLLEGKPVSSLPLNAFEEAVIKPYGFLTAKPVLYLCNVSEEDFLENRINNHVQAVLDAVTDHGTTAILSAKFEDDLADLDGEEQQFYLADFGLDKSGLSALIEATYALLGLATFFTTESSILRAWTFRQGLTAPACAGIIHSDFERGFIRAETIHCEVLFTVGTLTKAKETGQIRSEGKNYIVRDGDVILFRFNV